jgi:uncharacterized protein
MENAEEPMSLLEEIDHKLHEAMKAHDQRAAECLRMLKSKIIEKRTSAGFKGEVTDAVVRDVAATYVKSLSRAIGEFEKAGEAGADHIEKLKWEIAYLSAYQPTHLDEAATRAIVEATLKESGITDPAQSGRAIGMVMKSHKDEVDAALVRRLIEEILSKGA